MELKIFQAICYVIAAVCLIIAANMLEKED